MIFNIQKCPTSLTSSGHSNSIKQYLCLMKKTITQLAACWSSNAAHDHQYVMKTILNSRILWHKNMQGEHPDYPVKPLNNSGMPCHPAKPQPEWYCCVLLLFQMKNLISYLPSASCFHNTATRASKASPDFTVEVSTGMQVFRLLLML